MPLEKAHALILRLVDFSETSQVVTLFTKEFGKIGALAKGAHRHKGPFDSALDLLTRVRVVFLRKSSGGLDLLTEARLEHRFRPPDRDLTPLFAGYYVAELLLGLTDDYDPHPELFESAAQTLQTLSQDGEINISPLILAFEMNALRLLGHLPNLEECVECGKPMSTDQLVAFGQSSGGVLCQTCRPGKRHIAQINGESLNTLQWYARCKGNVDLVPPHQITGEIRGVINHSISHLLGRELKMQKHLRFLAQREGKT
ncbi:MAG: DNA repair protein RecO [Planctomycetaceae bacterium]|nr:DNA repair protein RecO [Planctomycetaceae bacterium]